jgi:hypothetical protein
MLGLRVLFLLRSLTWFRVNWLLTWVVYRKLGLTLLRTAWFNFDLVWAAALLNASLNTWFKYFQSLQNPPSARFRHDWEFVVAAGDYAVVHWLFPQPSLEIVGHGHALFPKNEKSPECMSQLHRRISTSRCSSWVSLITQIFIALFLIVIVR